MTTHEIVDIVQVGLAIFLFLCLLVSQYACRKERDNCYRFLHVIAKKNDEIERLANIAPYWHDVESNPEDLPIIGESVIASNGNASVFVVLRDGCTEDNVSDPNDNDYYWKDVESGVRFDFDELPYWAHKPRSEKKGGCYVNENENRNG